MAKWFDDWGTEFESEEEAREHTQQNMTWEDYKNEFQYIVSYDELLDWAKDTWGFEEHFSDAIMQAENEYFNAVCYKEED